MTWKAVLWTLVLSAVWCACVFWMQDGYAWWDFVRDGICWAILSLPVFFCFLKEAKHRLPAGCAILCGLVFGFPFFWTALILAYPDMIAPILMGTVGVILCVGAYPVIIWMDSPFSKEST